MIFRYIKHQLKIHRRNRKWILRILFIYIIMLIPNLFQNNNHGYHGNEAEDLFYFRLKRFQDYAASESNRTGDVCNIYKR